MKKILIFVLSLTFMLCAFTTCLAQDEIIDAYDTSGSTYASWNDAYSIMHVTARIHPDLLNSELISGYYDDHCPLGYSVSHKNITWQSFKNRFEAYGSSTFSFYGTPSNEKSMTVTIYY